MATIVDARGKPCPQPVIMTRKAILAGLPVTTIVDNDTARHNVTRMAEKAGYQVETEQGRRRHIYPRHAGAIRRRRAAARRGCHRRWRFLLRPAGGHYTGRYNGARGTRNWAIF